MENLHRIKYIILNYAALFKSFQDYSL